MIAVAQNWNPDDWEAFSLSLLQGRHGPLNVHKIPAVHKGDFGIDYYCTREAVAYQCYTAQEPIDIATRAEKQKKKMTTDLKKLIDSEVGVKKLFLGKSVEKWVLLVPMHDSKELNLHCAKKTNDVRSKACSHVHPEFEVCIHDQESFPGAALQAAMASLTNISLSVDPPSLEELAKWQAGSPDLLANATAKLSKRIPVSDDKEVAVKKAVSDAVEIFLVGNSLIDALRVGAPDIHEKVAAAITSRRKLLAFVGPQGGPAPNNILNTEVSNLKIAIKAAVPSLSQANAEDIALGTVSDWIMRCPLDFPANAS